MFTFDKLQYVHLTDIKIKGNDENLCNNDLDDSPRASADKRAPWFG